MIEQLGDRLARAVEWILAIAFIVAVCLNFANVIGRYILGVSMIGADEVQVFILVWITFLGAAVVSWRKLHLRMDVLVHRFPEPVRVGLQLAEMLLVVVLSSFVLYHAWLYTRRIVALEQVSDLAEIPMVIPHSAVVAGFGLMALIAVWRLCDRLLSGRRVSEGVSEGGGAP
jgi:TRAP-type C4-dicarboxylate transport system permease small subunit